VDQISELQQQPELLLKAEVRSQRKAAKENQSSDSDVLSFHEAH
jgi:hypothetical protein